MNHRKRQET